MLKPVAAALVLLSAFTAYFIEEFGTVIDANMVRNVLETDAHEAGEFLTGQFLAFFLLLGIVPASLVFIAPVRWPTLPKIVSTNSVRVLLSGALAAALVLSFYAHFASTIRENRDLLSRSSPRMPSSPSPSTAPMTPHHMLQSSSARMPIATKLRQLRTVRSSPSS